MRDISEAGPDEDGCETAEAAQHGVGVRGWVIRLGEPYLLAVGLRACCVMGEGLRDKMNGLSSSSFKFLQAHPTGHSSQPLVLGSRFQFCFAASVNVKMDSPGKLCRF